MANWNGLRRLRDNEKGVSLVFIGLGFTAVFAASSLAIDVGVMMTSRSQSQSSADSGALAGATALAFNSFTDHTAGGPAVSSAINAARSNRVVGQLPSVTAADVTFPLDPVTGESNRVQVTVYRNTTRGNPVSTFIAPIFGVPNFNISATATAAAVSANEENCVLPFTVPDRWIEKQCPPEICPWGPDNTFDINKTQGNKQNSGPPLANPDVYIPPGQPGATGYSATTDKGIQLVLKTNNGNNVTPSFYNPWDLPGSVGGNDYRDNIGGCNSNLIKIGDNMAPETGNMVGPTKSGVDTLVAKDPGAYWDTSCNCVKGSAFATSPRIRVMPLYNPVLYAQDQHSGKSQPTIQVANYLGIFVEGVTGAGTVTGRITPIMGLLAPGGGSAAGGFAKAITLTN